MGIKIILILIFVSISLKLSAQHREPYLNVEGGPASFQKGKHKYDLISDGIGYSAEANLDFWLYKRLAINAGLGINKYNYEYKPQFDTVFQFVQSANGCNCGFYTFNQRLFQLFVPFQIKYLFLNRDKLKLAATVGFQITYTIKDNVLSSSYRRLSNGKVDLTPHNYLSQNAGEMNEGFPILNKYALGLIMYNRINDNILFFTNLSYVFPYYFSLIRFEVGLALTKKQKHFYHRHSHG